VYYEGGRFELGTGVTLKGGKIKRGKINNYRDE
jgi:hypothetical protein